MSHTVAFLSAFAEPHASLQIWPTHTIFRRSLPCIRLSCKGLQFQVSQNQPGYVMIQVGLNTNNLIIVSNSLTTQALSYVQNSTKTLLAGNNVYSVYERSALQQHSPTPLADPSGQGDVLCVRDLQRLSRFDISLSSLVTYAGLHFWAAGCRSFQGKSNRLSYSESSCSPGAS